MSYIHNKKMRSLILYFIVFMTIFTCKLCKIGAQENFLQCMSTYTTNEYLTMSKYLHSQTSPTYTTLLQSGQQNPRWLNSSQKPEFIITPYATTEIRAAILCSKKHGYQIRVKSGGHDYEGLSYLCETPFIILDLVNLRSVTVDVKQETAWVQTGATLGELYYSIAQKSNVLGFPGGVCPSVGVGGHFSGGGFGTMLRKYGLAADHITDAHLMDASGRFLDRKSMGEDLFWAIRGGGGASFGVVLAWKVKLVRTPPIVTVFTPHRNLDQEGIKMFYKWQDVGNKLPENLFIRTLIQYSDETVQAIYQSLFLGTKSELIPLMNKSFPELGLKGTDCVEMSWIQSVLYFNGIKESDPTELLLNRTVQYKGFFKAKSDFVTKPIPMNAIEGIREKILQDKLGMLIMDPFGGKMDKFSESALPFPHRKGNLFNIQYFVKWTIDGAEEAKKHLDWITSLHEYMEPYVSSSPRAAYVNYRDLDLGINLQQNASYSKALIWGAKYFKGNFMRLAKVKTRIDPENFFRNQQSIPLLQK